MSGLAVIETKTNEITRETVQSYLRSFGLTNSLQPHEIEQFIEVAVAHKLNPFKREIYCIPYETSVQQSDGSWKKERTLSTVIGYEVYLKRAERARNLDGWKVCTEGKIQDNTLKAIITIHRKDWKEPFSHEVWFFEYNRNNKMWKKLPVTMLKKVAIAQGFRLCFPEEVGRLPYTPEEIGDFEESETTELDATEILNGSTAKIEPENEQEKQDVSESDVEFELMKQSLSNASKAVVIQKMGEAMKAHKDGNLTDEQYAELRDLANYRLSELKEAANGK